MPNRHPFLDHPIPTAIAHRGGSLEAEENTWSAFARAVALGYTHVELDVHATLDGVVVIHHDPVLTRMTGDSRAIAGLTWDELRRVRSLGGAEICRLDVLFEAFPSLCINIDAKSDTALEPLAEVIERAGALGRICVGSFQSARTARLRVLLGEGLCWSPAHAGVLRVWLRGWGLPVPVAGFRVVQVPLHYRGIPVVTPRFVRAAHRAGVLVQVWTVNEAAEMARLLDMGVDAIMTDRPSLLRQVLMERGQWRQE